jgi:dinuclear metal center YbgI/SA1388 family protein
VIALLEVVEYLDAYLRIREIPDDPNALNGLQVANRGRVGRIVGAVDASEATIEGLAQDAQRAAAGPALLLVHHGMFWDGHQPVAGRRYRKIRSLLEQDAALYAAHIPLDLHPELGNNAVLARALDLAETQWFGAHKGVLIGVAGRVPTALQSRDELLRTVARVLGIPAEAIRLVPGGPATVQRLGVISGAAGSAIGQAHAAGCDTFLTGEGAAHTYFDAMELGVNVLFAGHYATETVGVRELARHLGERFGLPWSFHDHPTGM